MLPALAAVVRESASRCTSAGCVNGAKAAFAAALFAEGLVFAHAAVLVNRFLRPATAEHALHLGRAMASGVFFAAGVILFLPEAVNLLAANRPDAFVLEQASFPVPYAMLLAAFYVMFFFEQVLLPRFAANSTALPVTAPRRTLQKDDEMPSMIWHAHRRSKTAESDIEAALSDPNPMYPHKKPDADDADDCLEDAKSEKTLHGSAFLNQTFLTSMLIVLSLSLPSFMMSMVLGAADDFSTALHLFIGLAAHRWIIAAAIGFKFEGYGLKYREFLVVNLTFALMAPAGLGIGTALSSVPVAFGGVTLALGAGVFIYVGALQLPAEELGKHPKWELSKIAAVIIGALVTVLIAVLLIVLPLRASLLE